jgi:chromosome segregation ATPase
VQREPTDPECGQTHEGKAMDENKTIIREALRLLLAARENELTEVERVFANRQARQASAHNDIRAAEADVARAQAHVRDADRELTAAEAQRHEAFHRREAVRKALEDAEKG